MKLVLKIRIFYLLMIWWTFWSTAIEFVTTGFRSIPVLKNIDVVTLGWQQSGNSFLIKRTDSFEDGLIGRQLNAVITLISNGHLEIVMRIDQNVDDEQIGNQNFAHFQNVISFKAMFDIMIASIKNPCTLNDKIKISLL